MFILSMGFFITPVLLGGGRVMMIAVLIEQQVREFLNWEFAGALSATLLVFTLLVYAAFRRLMRGDRQPVRVIELGAEPPARPASGARPAP